ncbi:ABC transporter substrate-binding protein [Rhodococcus sp. T2V]|uniref:ABC transporter substrate-binding protein n=1 Tax=Rhodococcus sp. T2V TaxID=3034164 RepID=UPI0023E0FD84|nr:ABC transporter substrate-binding protein [Rhodococcus sp. T2V]MDF3312209.1 ABC transporter substrate-binding protein [Rhodococcus sp. T2V]
MSISNARMRGGGAARLTATLAAVLLVAGCAGASSQTAADPAAPPRVVIDSTGASVTVPGTVERVADAWQAHNEVVAMLGAGEKVVATVSTKELVPWLYEVNPHMNDAKTVFTNTTADVEALLAQRPDVVFMPAGSKVSDALGDLNIPTVQLTFTDYDGLKQVVSTTGDVLGGSAPSRAADFNAYLDKNLAKVRGATSSIGQAERPKVLHITSLNPLIVDGTDTIIDAWIQAAGGRNAAVVPGNNVGVNIEQILAWNPDVIILGSTTLTDPSDPDRAARELTADPAWARVSAVQSARVHMNPVGAFFWDRYSAEGALQLLWAGKLLHPELFTDVDMVAETTAFYRTFLGYDLTDDQARAILTAHRP